MKFVKVVLDKESEIFVVHVLALKTLEMTIQPSQIAQIIDNKPIQIVVLK